jgi:hypothetical protein
MSDREALERIAKHPGQAYDSHPRADGNGDRQWQIGFSDGLRAAAEIARAALGAGGGAEDPTHVAARKLIDCCRFKTGMSFSMQKGFHPALRELWAAVYPEAAAKSDPRGAEGETT